MKLAIMFLMAVTLVFGGLSTTFAETVNGVELGKVYEVKITEEKENKWEGKLGIARIGDDVRVKIKDAKTGETYKVKVTDVENHHFDGKPDAVFEIVK